MLERVFFGTVAYIRSIRWHRGNCPPFLPSHVENTKKATEHRHGIPSLFGHVHLEIAMGFVLKCWEQHGTPMHIYICVYEYVYIVGDWQLESVSQCDDHLELLLSDTWGVH